MKALLGPFIFDGNSGCKILFERPVFASKRDGTNLNNRWTQTVFNKITFL